jgi:hypothetical protein
MPAGPADRAAAPGAVDRDEVLGVRWFHPPHNRRSRANVDTFWLVAQPECADADAPATFFEVGEHIATYDPGGKIEREMLADGDTTDGFEPCLFRAPGGTADSALLAVARSMGFATIQWDVDPGDWALPGTSAIVNNVVAHAHDGAIVEEHFGGGPRYETLDALPREIAELRAKGYQLVTLTQMLGYKLVYR